MSVFKTSHLVNGQVITFAANPYVSRDIASRGWLISAHSLTGEYGGHYVRYIGWADEVPGIGPRAFRTKRDAKAAMAEAISLGILKVAA